MKKIILSVFLFSFIILSFYKITFAETKKIKLSEIGFLANTESSELIKELENKRDGLLKITSPKSSKKYNSGDVIKIKWKDTSDQDYLMSGVIINEEIEDALFMFEDEINKGYYNFVVPKDILSGKYFIVIGDKLSETRLAVSKSFTIKTKTKLENSDMENQDSNSRDMSDAKAKASLNNSRIQGEIFYDMSGSYSDVCKKSLSDYGIKDYVKDAGKYNGKKTDCDSSSTAWAAEVKLKSEKGYFCVDSIGYNFIQNKSKGSKSTSCDGTKDDTKYKNSKTSKSVILDTDHFLSGNASSKIKIITYSDLECPYCVNFDHTLRQISQEYGDKVGIVFRHFPLSQIHENSELAANAAECVANLGGENKFSSYIEKLFLNSPELDFSNLSEIAQNIGANKSQFESCLLNETYSKKVKNDYKLGSKFVSGTPYSIVYDSNGNTQEIAGAQTFNEVKRLIESVMLK